MAKGYPDYFAVPSIPHYGGALMSTAHKDVTVNDHTTIVEVSGKGVLYYAECYARSFMGIEDDDIELHIDGNMFATIRPSFETLIGAVNPVFGVWFCTENSPSVPRTLVSYSGPLPFETSISVVYEERNGNGSPVDAILRYSLVTV
jgi:hypothetical protein